jgi:glycosyltransferase involved in cell wall biosynthesis
MREVDGLDSAVKVARLAVKHVAPAKSLYALYQLLGSYLNSLGEPEAAVDAVLEGVAYVAGNEARLIELALRISAAEMSSHLLQKVIDCATAYKGLELAAAFGDVLFHEQQQDWRRAVEAAQRGRLLHPSYLHFKLHEVLCWLAVGEPEKAEAALDSFFPQLAPQQSDLWLSAVTALNQGKLPQASRYCDTYLGARAPTTQADIRAALLREWDYRVGTVGETNPALVFPILPPAVTGLEFNICRPQYGPPVLPQHQGQPEKSPRRQRTRLRILAVGTEWHSGHGGLSTFNRQLCRALVDAGAEVVCLLLHTSPEDRQDAGDVTLVEANRAPGQLEGEALSRRPKLPDGFAPDVIIGHGRVTGPAAQALAEDDFPEAKRLHFVHMAPDEIEWFKLDRDDDAGARAEDRTTIELDLGCKAARVVAVGPRLYNRYLRDLSAYEVLPPLRLDPGFDSQIVGPRIPPPGEPWSILVLGRVEDPFLKGIDIAAKAVGLTASRRGPAASALELMVRGARPDTSTELQNQLQDWSGNTSLSIVVRPFTAATEILDADIRRASLILMPSRKEGFGLAGLEAIVAGTPVLVSNESGLGTLLRETLEQEQAKRIVIPITGDPKDDSEAWARAIEGILHDREAAFTRAGEVRALLASQKSWAAAIANLLAKLGLTAVKAD